MKYKVIHIINESVEANWFQLSDRCGTVFSSQAWLELWRPDIELLGIEDCGSQELIGGFVLHTLKLKGITTISNAPFTPHIALFVKPIEGHATAQHSKKKQIVESICTFLEGRKEKIKSISFPPDWEDLQPFAWSNYKLLTRYTYVLGLDQDVETLWNNLNSKTRNVIGKADRDGVEVTTMNSFEEPMSILAATYARKKTAFREDDFKKMLVSLQTDKNLSCLVAKYRGKIVATGLFLFNERCAYYIAGGYDAVVGHSGAGAKVLWQGIQEAKNRKCPTFDFEGSMIPEVEKFFRGFGGSMLRYHHVTKAPFLIEMLLKFKRRGEF